MKKDEFVQKAAQTDDRQVYDRSVFPGIFDETAMAAYAENTEAYKQLFLDAKKYHAVHIAHIEVFYDNGYEKHQVIPEEEMPEGVLSDDELEVLERINNKFANFGSEDISNYSHREKGYTETKKGEIISYSYAKDIELN